MNNISKLLLGAAALGLWACSNDEPANAPETKPVEGDVAYLNVNILAGDASSRSGSQIDDKDFIYGDGNENVVNNAYFYFYDEKGNFVSEANSWTNGPDGTEENVEKLGKGTVILKGLTGKDYPTWVVTVLNKPDGLTAQRTIEDMGKQLVQSVDDAYTSFVMSTSSYFGEGTENSPYYFATKLNPENFLQEYPTKEEFTDAERVDIYVERLAARVQVSASNLKATVLDNGKEGYELDVTVAGKPNADEVGGVTDGVAAEKVYIVFEGWGLNATAQKSTLSKSLEGWNAQTTFAGDWAYANAWNHADYHRSYWGKSTVYGLDGGALAAKLHVGENYFTDLDQVVGTKRLNGTRLYCNENTNEVENITDGNLPMPNKTTTVLLAARVCDAKGNPLNLVNYLGVNYLKEAFMNKVFDITNPQYYSRTPKGTIEVNGETIQLYSYKQIEPADCELVAAGNGTGTVDVNVAASNPTPYYTLGEPKFVEVPADDATGTQGAKLDTIYPNATEVPRTTINNTLKNATAGESNYAVAYTDGATVYSIPLEHINNANNENAKVEGQWGTVRNHIYSLDITKISSLGDGVFKPYSKEEGGELIDPNKPKNPLYYVESNINILSWKIVTQEADI